jgi:hypothetical protein
MQVDKKTFASKLDEDNDDRRKEVALLKAHIQKEREEMRGQVTTSVVVIVVLVGNDVLNLQLRQGSLYYIVFVVLV